MACGCKSYILCVTHRDMRNWVRERMRRRKKKQPEGEAEATGKVGQQKPPVDELHPEPLVPSYGTEKADTSGATPPIIEAPGHGRRMETEVQPESPSTPPPGSPEQRPAQAQKSAPGLAAVPESPEAGWTVTLAGPQSPFAGRDLELQ